MIRPHRRRTRTRQSYSSGQVVLMCTNQRQIQNASLGTAESTSQTAYHRFNRFALTAEAIEGPNSLEWAAPFRPQNYPFTSGPPRPPVYMVPWVHPNPRQTDYEQQVADAYVVLRCDLIMVALWNRADHYIFILSFVLSSSFFFSSPNLSRRRLDGCHTSTHGVALVRI